jgi:hypothetical protein
MGKVARRASKQCWKPEEGYDVHHIMEKTAADRDGHSQEDIDGPDVLLRLMAQTN